MSNGRYGCFAAIFGAAVFASALYFRAEMNPFVVSALCIFGTVFMTRGAADAIGV